MLPLVQRQKVAHVLKAKRPAVPRPSAMERAAIWGAQAHRPSTRAAHHRVVDGEFGSPHSDAAGYLDRLRDTFGSVSVEFASTCLAWLLVAREQPGMPPEVLAKKANAALAAIAALRPCNEAEAMLALQIVATHDLAMEAL